MVRIEPWGDDRLALYWAAVTLPWGNALVVGGETFLCECWFTDSTNENLAAIRARYPLSPLHAAPSSLVQKWTALFQNDDVNLVLRVKGTPFERSVWQTLLKIPSGQTASYQWVAEVLGKPSAVRAVARAIGKNPVSFFVPCHRVIYADGRIGHYRWGDKVKRKLLEGEFEKNFEFHS